MAEFNLPEAKNPPSVGAAPELSPGLRREASPDAFGGGENLDRGITSAQNAVGVSVDLLQKQKQNIDEIAVAQADLGIQQAKTAAIGQVMQQYKGLNADQALSAGQKIFSDSVDKLYKGMQNPQQQKDFYNMAMQHASGLVETLTAYRTDQLLKADATTTEARVKGYADEGIQSGGDPKQIALQSAQIKAVWQDYGRRNGLAPEVTRQAQLDSLSVMHGGVVSNFLAQGNYKAAQSYFDQNKADISPARTPGLQNELRQGAVTDLAVNIWQKFGSSYRLENGGININKIQQDIEKQSGFTPAEKLGASEKLRGLAREDAMGRAQQKQDETDSFMDWGVKSRSNNVPLATAMQQLSTKVNPNEPYDYAKKVKALQEIYAPAKESNPDTYLYFKNELATGTVDPSELDKAFYQDDTLSLKDYAALGGKNVKNVKEGVDPSERYADQAVNQMIKDHFGDDPQESANFHRALDAQNLKGQAKQDWAAKALGEDKKENMFRGLNIDWKSDLKASEAQNAGVQQLRLRLGAPTLEAINSGFRAQGGPNYMPKSQDLLSFVDHYGGPEKVAPGTPVYAAIQLAMEYHHPVTTQLIDGFLKKYPTGQP